MNRNRKIKRIAAGVLSLTLALAPATQALAAEKEENVYDTLENDGSVSGIYVVNSYSLDSDKQITDYGDYSSVKNLSSDEDISVSGDKITVDASKGKFYYQGNLSSKALPWNIELHYYLDGNEVDASELGGASGEMKITMKVSENKNVDSDFFNNYLLQAEVVLDTDKCTEIKADGATVGNEGSDNDLIYNFLGGSSRKVEITADIEDFEMDAITFKGVPMSFSIDKDDLDLSDLYGKTDSISDAAAKLDDGADKLTDGISSYTSAVKNASDGSENIVSAISKLVSGTEKLKNGSSSLYSGTKKYTDSVKSYTSGVDSYIDGVDSMYKSLQQSAKQLKQAMLSPDAATAASAKAQYQSIQTLLAGFEKLTANDSKLKSAGEKLDSSSESILSCASSVKSGISDLDSGLEKTKNGASKLSSGLSELDSKSSDLNDGASELSSNTEKFKDKTSGLSNEVDDQIDDMLSKLDGSDYTPISFASSKNTDVSLVQFVMRTDAIEKPEVTETKTTEKKQTLWDRIKALF